jgi:hypothetical protein
MLSGQGLSPSNDTPRKRHPVTTTIIVVLMMAVLFGATYGVVRLIRGGGSATPGASATTPAPCVTTTVKPGVVLPKPGTVTVNVYNATNRAGLAKRTSAVLATRGFPIGHVANDPLGKSVKGVAEVRYGPSGAEGAKLLVYYVPGAALVADQRTDASVDLVLGEKFKTIAPQKAVDAALVKPTPVATGTGCASPAPKSSTSTKASRSVTPSPSKA